jgi:hypothetical protein
MGVHDPDSFSEVTLYVFNRKNEIGIIRHNQLIPRFQKKSWTPVDANTHPCQP